MTPRPRFWLALGGAILVIGAGLYLGYRFNDGRHFARSGAIVVILGALLTSWDGLRAGNNMLLLLRNAISRDRMPAETLGLCLMVLGTLIWALGDLLFLVAPGV